MELTEKLESLIQPVLERSGVGRYELKWIGNEKTLQVAVVKPDGTMDLDTCAMVSEALSEVLDQAEDLIPTAYTLEVCSPGAEREIRDVGELRAMDHPYVFVRLKHPIGKFNELTGEVQSYEGNIIRLTYRDKAAVRTAEFEDGEIEYLRLAVRI